MQQLITNAIGDVVQHRFWVAFGVAIVPPLLHTAFTLLKLGFREGMRWVKNDPAFSLFALIMLPLLSSYLAEAVDERLVQEAPHSTLMLAVFLLAATVVVFQDAIGNHSIQPPAYFRSVDAIATDVSIRSALPKPSDEIFRLAREGTSPHQGVDAANRYAQRHPSWRTPTEFVRNASAAAWMMVATNVVAAIFASGLLWYTLVLVLTRTNPLMPHSRNTIALVYSLALLWFPLRLYAEWYTNYYGLRHLRRYDALLVLAILALFGLVALAVALKPEEPLPQAFALVQLMGAGLVGVASIWKPEVIAKVAAWFEGTRPASYAVIGIAWFATIWVMFSSISLSH